MNIKTYNFDALYDDWLETTPEAKLLKEKLSAYRMKVSDEERNLYTEKYSYWAIHEQWMKEFDTHIVDLGGKSNMYKRILATPKLDEYIKDLNLLRALANKKEFRPKYEHPYQFRYVDMPEAV